MTQQRYLKAEQISSQQNSWDLTTVAGFCKWLAIYTPEVSIVICAECRNASTSVQADNGQQSQFHKSVQYILYPAQAAILPKHTLPVSLVLNVNHRHKKEQ